MERYLNKYGNSLQDVGVKPFLLKLQFQNLSWNTHGRHFEVLNDENKRNKIKSILNMLNLKQGKHE